MAKVYISSGHGGSDPGAVKYVIEKDVNLKMALACSDYLINCGVTVMFESKPGEDTLVKDIVKECNKFCPNLAIDIHNNAGGGDGFEVYHSRIGGLGKIAAQNLEAEILKIGQNSRGVKYKLNDSGSDYFGFIRDTTCPAVIVEGAFVDNRKDAAQIDTDEECEAFGIAYAKAILKTLGVPDKYKDSKKLYKVQVGAFSNRKNAEKLREELNEKGYKGFIVCED